MTEDILHNPNPVILLISPKLESANDQRIDEINNIYDYTLENQYAFYCVTGSSDTAINDWIENSGAEYPFLTADEVLLKTIIRSNPGLVLLKDGTVLAKLHYNDFPKEEKLKAVIGYYLSKKGDVGKEDGRIRTNILTFTVPLLLVWIYDYLRNRRKKKKENK